MDMRFFRRHREDSKPAGNGPFIKPQTSPFTQRNPVAQAEEEPIRSAVEEEPGRGAAEEEPLQKREEKEPPKGVAEEEQVREDGEIRTKSGNPTGMSK